MTGATTRRLGWSARLLIALTLLLAGAAAATWALARFDRAAQLLGVAPPPPRPVLVRQVAALPPPQSLGSAPAGTIADLEARLARVENATRRAEGSAGRADALVVAFAARRAVDRGVALGYLEPLLVARFGQQQPGAVATIVTAARSPVVLEQLADELEQLAPRLRGGPGEDWWTSVKRELGSVVEIRHADRPSDKPDARFDRAVQRVRAGQVDAALAEVMRLPGASRAGPWVARARRYVAAHRALDAIESSALLVGVARG